MSRAWRLIVSRQCAEEVCGYSGAHWPGVADRASVVCMIRQGWLLLVDVLTVLRCPLLLGYSVAYTVFKCIRMLRYIFWYRVSCGAFALEKGLKFYNDFVQPGTLIKFHAMCLMMYHRDAHGISTSHVGVPITGNVKSGVNEARGASSMDEGVGITAATMSGWGLSIEWNPTVFEICCGMSVM